MSSGDAGARRARAGALAQPQDRQEHRPGQGGAQSGRRNPADWTATSNTTDALEGAGEDHRLPLQPQHKRLLIASTIASEPARPQGSPECPYADALLAFGLTRSGTFSALDAALIYAERCNWAVLPIAPGTKAPCFDPVDLPNGKNSATTDPDLIRRWWRRWPRAGVGIAAAPSRLVFTDVDPRNGGLRSYAALIAEHGATSTARVETGRGDNGYHEYLIRPPSLLPRNGTLGPGVDLIGLGYVVAPPTRHPVTGRPYRWVTRGPLSELPRWMAAALLPRVRLVPYSAPQRPTDATTLADLFVAAGLVRAQNGDRLFVMCPWAADHTSDNVSSTLVFPPGARTARGWFHCSHAHCAGRLQRDVWTWLRCGRSA